MNQSSSYGWEAYLNAIKIDLERVAHDTPSEEEILRDRLRTVKAERNRLKKYHQMARIPKGWTIGKCECGFMITTLPDGKHYCPKCD